MELPLTSRRASFLLLLLIVTIGLITSVSAGRRGIRGRNRGRRRPAEGIITSISTTTPSLSTTTTTMEELIALATVTKEVFTSSVGPVTLPSPVEIEVNVNDTTISDIAATTADPLGLVTMQVTKVTKEVAKESSSFSSSSSSSSSSRGGQGRQNKHRLLQHERQQQAYPVTGMGGGNGHPRSDVQIGCKELRSKRYISDGFCTSIKPVTEVVCTGHCLPMTNLPWYAEFIKVWARTKVLEWRCVNDVVKRRRVRLLCENGETRTYRIKVVKSCKCKRYMKQQNQSLASKGRTNGSNHHRRREKITKKTRTNWVPS